MSGKEYAGPESNETYEDTDTMETFDDLDDVYGDNEEVEQQGTHSHDGESFEEGEEADEHAKEKAAVKKSNEKKEAAKKARGQKNDDLDSLTDEEEEEEETEEEEEEDEEEEKEEEKEEEEEEKPEEKPADKKAKAKPTYVTVDGETYALDSNAVISTPVDGKIEKVTLQDLKNNYAGKVAYDKKFNEVNLKEQSVKRQEQEFVAEKTRFGGVKQKIEEIIKDPAKNPKDALKIFLDSAGVDSYDLMERMFKADLTELANVLNMEPAERKAYFLEKKNSHLLEQSKKRDEQRQTDERVTSYRQKVDALRKSYGVSEAQYVDALEELKSFEGVNEKDLSEKEIVEWAATKPHRETVRSLLTPYKDQLVGDAYDELSWKLANILRAGQETSDDIKKHLKEVYGIPTKVKQLSKKLNPLGRKGKPAQPVSSKKGKLETFDDLDDE